MVYNTAVHCRRSRYGRRPVKVGDSQPSCSSAPSAFLPKHLLPGTFANGNDCSVLKLPFDRYSIKLCCYTFGLAYAIEPVLGSKFSFQHNRYREKASACLCKGTEKRKILELADEPRQHIMSVKPSIELAPDSCIARRQQNRRAIQGLRKTTTITFCQLRHADPNDARLTKQVVVGANV